MSFESKQACRREALDAYGILDTHAEPEFDGLAHLAAAVAATPYAAVIFLDVTRAWSKATYGFEREATQNIDDLCHAVVNAEAMLQVSDLLEYAPMKTRPPKIEGTPQRYFLGLPLKTSEGLVLGMLCVFDAQVRQVDQVVIGRMSMLAEQVINMLELRRFKADLIAAQVEIKQLKRSNADFIANLNHEFRTPLHAIIGLTEMVLECGTLQENVTPLNQVIQAAKGLLRMVEDLLEFNRMNSQGLQLAEVQFDLNERVHSVVAGFRNQAENRGLQLGYQVREGIPAWVIGDPLKLERILAYLIDNGLKFTSKGRVLVTLSPLGCLGDVQEIEVEVADTGVGIEQSKQAAICEAFVQEDASATRHFGGIGLGLAMVTRLVSAMMGRINVQSVPGEGSVFRVVLPFGVAVSNPSSAAPEKTEN